MTQARAHPRKPADPPACRTPEAIGRQLDEELEQSFPASDPPSMVRDAPAPVCDTQKPPAGTDAARREKKRHRRA